MIKLKTEDGGERKTRMRRMRKMRRRMKRRRRRRRSKRRRRRRDISIFLEMSVILFLSHSFLCLLQDILFLSLPSLFS